MEFYFGLGIIIAYLIGSFPTAVVVGKTVYGIDVREHGSGNSGATNTFRVLGKKPGAFVLFIDVLKGFIAVFFISMLFERFFDKAIFPDFKIDLTLRGYHLLHYQLTNEAIFPFFKLILAISAVVGHIYPVFARFKGGKGVATMLGILFAIQPIAAFISIAIFALVFGLSNYVSLGSITGALVYPLIVRFVINHDSMLEIYFSFLVAFIVIYTHRKNIIRLVNGNESKIYLRSKEK